MIIVFTWGSFTIGVRSVKGLPDDIDLDEDKWAKDVNEDDNNGEMALHNDEKKSKKTATERLKSLFGKPKSNAADNKENKPKAKKTKKAKSKTKGKPSRVSALASRRRK